jgi:peptidyl-prolyl cis-trans isomerase C
METERRYMKALRYCIMLIIAGLAFGTLFAFAEPKELARIDGIVITDTYFRDRAMMLSERDRKVGFDRQKFLDKLIDEELIIRDAQKLNLHDKEEYTKRVEAFKKSLLVDLYLQQYLKEHNTEENQRKYYDEKKEKYITPETVKISVILIKTEDEAKDILKKAREGEDFAELAKKYSKAPSAPKGGDFGARSRKGLRKDFDVAFSMKVGEISDLIKTNEGYYIIKLTDHTNERISTYEEVKSQIASEYMRKLLEERISELRKAVNIKIDSAELKNLTIK